MCRVVFAALQRGNRLFLRHGWENFEEPGQRWFRFEIVDRRLEGTRVPTYTVVPLMISRWLRTTGFSTVDISRTS